jgi:hypothetical protein
LSEQDSVDVGSTVLLIIIKPVYLRSSNFSKVSKIADLSYSDIFSLYGVGRAKNIISELKHSSKDPIFFYLSYTVMLGILHLVKLSNIAVPTNPKPIIEIFISYLIINDIFN